jgi:cephalosporin-C deacetylase-like acetyl esterase
MDVNDELRDLLFAYDRDMPLASEGEVLAAVDGLVEERFSFDSVHSARVPGVLVYMRELPAPRPALLIQHGLNSGKDDQRLALLRRVWAAHGFACVTIDAPLHGERAAGPVDVLDMLSRPYSGLHFVQQHVVDLRRAVDYLVERADIDPRRLGYVGFSMSTFLGVQFVAVEQRIRAACLAMGGAGLFHFLVSRAPEDRRADQELVARLVDPLHYAPRISPRPVLQVNGQTDEVVPAALGHMLHGALAEPKRVIWYPGGHDGIPEETVAEMRLFLEQALSIGSPVG